MRRQILVVEDERPIQALVCDLLQEEDYEVVCVASPEAVLHDVSQYRPDLFILDIMLPHMSGIELATQLRNFGFTDTPIIGMSASRLMAAVARGSGVFDEVIDKPFDIDPFMETIKHHLRAAVSIRDL